MQTSKELLGRVSRLTAVKQDIRCPASDWIKQLRKFSSSIPEPILGRELDILRSMSDSTRLTILHLLSQGRDLCACEIQVAVNQSQPLTSHHLNALRKAGLVESRRIGTWVYYRLSDKRLARILSVLRDLTKEEAPALLKAEVALGGRKP